MKQKKNAFAGLKSRREIKGPAGASEQKPPAEPDSLKNLLTAESFLDIAAQIIVALDKAGRIEYLNESGLRLLGYRDSFLLGKDWFETCLPIEDREAMRRFFELLKNGATRGDSTHENYVLTSAGERRAVLWHNTVLRNEEGEFLGTLSSGEDITERIQMEKALRVALAKYKTLFECFPQGITVSDNKGNILETNPAAARILGAPRQEHERRNISGPEWRIVRPDGTPMPPGEYPSVRALREKRLVENVEMGVQKPDRSLAWLSATAAPLPIENYGVVVTYSDISARKRAQDLLQARLRLSQFADTHTLDELLQKSLDEAEQLTYSQIGFAHFVQEDQQTIELQAWSTNTLTNMCSAEGKGRHYNVEQAGTWAECIRARAPVIHNDYAGLPASRRKGFPPGHAPVIRELTAPVIRGGLVVAVFGVGNKAADYTDEDVDIVLQLANMAWDIVQRKRTEEALKASEKKYRLLYESMMDGFVRVDMEGHILEYNRAYKEMLGYSDAELTALTYVDITPEAWHEAERRIVEEQVLPRGYSDIYEKEYRKKNGIVFPVELRTTLLRGEEGEPSGMWAIVRDITARKKVKEALENTNAELKAALEREKQLANTDILTGVNNRRRLYEIAAREAEVAARYLQPFSMILFDLDHFKKVNDTFGHVVGDQILTKVAQTACAELRAADAIGRYGGEEFIILLPMTGARQALSLAERIRENVAKIRVETPLGEAAVTISAGIVELKRKGATAETIDDMIRRSDRAMYAAKQAGRNRVKISE